MLPAPLLLKAFMCSSLAPGVCSLMTKFFSSSYRSRCYLSELLWKDVFSFQSRPDHEQEIGVEESDKSSNSALNLQKMSYSERGNEGKECRGKGKNQEDNKHTVPFYKLFSFADSTDVILMIVGSLGAVGNGLALPLMTVLFGDVIQSFGGASDVLDVLVRVSTVALDFVYLAVGAGIVSFLHKITSYIMNI